jgi:hypothetical protein
LCEEEGLKTFQGYVTTLFVVQRIRLEFKVVAREDPNMVLNVLSRNN